MPFWDITVSVSKSITLFYGGLLAAAEQARRAGDTARAEHLERRAGRVWAAIMEGNRAALEYLQDEAGMTRTGYHRGSGTESGAELGKWEHARDWVIGSFRQHTSRDGDPQLHVHNLVLNKVATERDGRWRKLDSRSLYRFQGAAAAIAAAVTETALTREFGVAWVPRADGHGREIAGISQELMDAFSSRRQTITPEARKVAAEREAETGRRPDARQMYRIQKDIAYRTRARKPEAPLDIRAKLREWEQTAREKDLGELAAIPDAVAEAARQARERALEQAEQDAPAEAVLRVARAIGWEFARQHGRAPDADEFRRIERFARFITLNGTDTRPVEPGLLLRGWEAQERADAQAQYQIRREIARAQARSGPPPEPARERARAVAYPVPTARSERGSGAIRDGRGDRGHPGSHFGVDQGGPDPLPGRSSSGRGDGRPGHPGDPRLPRAQRRGRGTGGAAVRAGMAARPRRVAPRGRRIGVPAARRRTLRQPGAAHPGRTAPGASARTRRAAPGPCGGGAAARRGRGAAPGATPARSRRRGVGRDRPGAGCGWIRPPPPGTC